MSSPSGTRPQLPAAIPRRALRIVTVTGGLAVAEDLVLDRVEATERFGADVAALIFDDKAPGALDLTHRTAALRYGAHAAELIFPAVAGAHAPAVTGHERDEPTLALPLVDRVVS